jgi:hypothetical protein
MKPVPVSLAELHDFCAANGGKYTIEETRIRCELVLTGLPGVNEPSFAPVFLRRMVWRVEMPIGVGLLIPSDEALAGGLTLLAHRQEPEPRTIDGKVVTGGVAVLSPLVLTLDRRGDFNGKLRHWAHDTKGDTTLRLRFWNAPLAIPIALADVMQEPILIPTRLAMWVAHDGNERPPEVEVRDFFSDAILVAEHREDTSDLTTGRHSASGWMVAL